MNLRSPGIAKDGIGPSTALRAALLGHGIGQSKTPEMHMAEGRAQGIDYRFDRFDVGQSPYNEMTASEILQFARDHGYAGLNVTHPFKERVCDLVDQMSPSAQLLGAVNTIVISDGVLTGHNTDYTGFKRAFAAEMSDAAKGEVLLIGAGGAGAAVAFALVDSGVTRLTIFDVARQSAVGLRNRILEARPGAEIRTPGSLKEIAFSSLDGVVNATPIGMEKHPGTAIHVEDLSSTTWVADIIYFPLETELLKRARAHGCRTMAGSGMAIFQAIDAFQLLTGRQADPARFRDSFQKLAKDT